MKRFESPKNIKKLLIPAIPVVLALVALGIFSVLPKSNIVNLEGSVEISTNTLVSQVNGIAKEVFVQPGETVQAGDMLAKLEEKDIDNQIAQLEATLVIKKAKYKELLRSPQAASIAAAREAAKNSVSICREKEALAKKALEIAEKELKTQKILFAEEAISQNELRRYETIVSEKQTAVNIAKAEVAAAENNVNTFVDTEASVNDLEAAEADIALTALQIQNLKDNKSNYTILSKTDGIVIERKIEADTPITAGQPLFEVSNGKDRNFVFYLPQEHMDKISYGDSIALYRINGKAEIGTATVEYMDWKAVYTPKDYENSSNKNQKSIRVKARIESTETLDVGETLVTRIEKQE